MKPDFNDALVTSSPELRAQVEDALQHANANINAAAAEARKRARDTVINGVVTRFRAASLPGDVHGVGDWDASLKVVVPSGEYFSTFGTTHTDLLRLGPDGRLTLIVPGYDDITVCHFVQCRHDMILGQSCDRRVTMSISNDSALGCALIDRGLVRIDD